MFELLRSWIKPIIYVTLAFFLGLIILEWGADFTTQGNYNINSQVVGVVNGEDVPANRYDITYRNLFEQRYGSSDITPSDDQVARLRAEAWNALVADIAIQQELDRLGVEISEEDLYYYLRYSPPGFLQSHPAFQTDGQFDYQKYLQTMADPSNAAFWAQAEIAIIPQLRQTKMQEIITTSARITPEEVKDAYLSTVESASFEVLMMASSSLDRELVTATDEEIQNYYRDHSYRFQREETRSMELVLFSKDITELDWDRVREDAQRIADTVKTPDTDFGFFAEIYSEDGSASDGGDIGWYPLTDLDSLYVAGALALEVNGISDPVRSSFGWHVIKLLGMKDTDGAETTDSEKCTDIHTAHILFQVQSSDVTVDAAETRARGFYHSATKSGFAAAAEEHDVAISNIGSFTKNGSMQLIGQDFYANEWAFKSSVGDISGIYSNASNFFVMHLTGSQAESTIPLEEIRPSIENLVRNEKLNAICMETMTALHATLDADSDFKELANDTIQLVTTAKMTRRGAMPLPIGQDPKATGSAFALRSSGDFSGPVALDRGAAIFKLIEKESPGLDEFSQAQDSVATYLLQQKQQAVWNNWYTGIALKAESENFLERRIADSRTFVDTVGAF